jgi:tRNA pseudouridine38-40 synthase
MRIACILAYEGTNYAGWQLQVNTPTVQEKIEQAISQVATHPARVICAGRTDRGVHANFQVIHFDTDCQRENEIWKAAINDYLPPDIRILSLQTVDADFHARYSAENRTYRYLIYQGSMPWFRQYSWMMTRSLQLKAMQKAARDLIGEHDFSAFRGAGCQAASPMRHIIQLSIIQKANWIKLNITANGFLYHMVRNIVGVLVEVGKGKRAPDSMPPLLKSRDRQKASITAPPQGLYLRSICYPERFKLFTEQEKRTGPRQKYPF